MKPSVACSAAVAVLLLAGCTAEFHPLDLVRMLGEKQWLERGLRSRWDRGPRVAELDRTGPERLAVEEGLEDPEAFDDEDIAQGSEKRSAVATALNAGRRRRQPTPALGKGLKPYAGVGVLNNMGSFFDVLRGNLETLVSLSPQQRATLFKEPPTVIQAGNTAGGGGGTGFRKLHNLRPLRPTGNIRSYNRRSFMETDGMYPGANRHDPGLLWTGLGR